MALAINIEDQSNRVPFDERGNPDIRIEDISTLLLREYLVKVKSKLVNDLYTKPLQEILEQMDLYVGPKENRVLRNVAAMMFCEEPSKYFKRTQVEIVYFPEGRLRNPSNLFEEPIITGSVPQMIDRTLEYLKRMLVVQVISKPKDDYRSVKHFTYPYQALEESVTNALYHRDYREWEPIVITIEPQGITIQNVGGPDRSIPSADITKGNLLISKRYRNRRLGEFLKELDMTEGRSTGIPTIQNVLEANGSPRATIVTDEDRTFFRITIPCHESAGNILSDISRKDESLKVSKRGLSKNALPKDSDKSEKGVLKFLRSNPHATYEALSAFTGYSRSKIAKIIRKMQEENIIKRVGSNRIGYWKLFV
jgi:ATP-dependent DNA helicase RecG